MPEPASLERVGLPVHDGEHYRLYEARVEYGVKPGVYAEKTKSLTAKAGVPFEWGGKDKRGVSDFAAKRPTWALPIHQLMAKTGVTIFFQGHDHIYARQELDGIIYQTCPNPADAKYQTFNRDAYRSGDVLPNSGHVAVQYLRDESAPFVENMRMCGAG